MSGKVHATPAPEKPVPRPGGYKYDAFLTHDWGKDEHDRSNHARVGQVNEALKARGVATWFDQEQMEGNVVEQMVAGIDDSAVCVVFVTKRYMEKVAQRENPNDNCKREFGYSVRKKTTNRIVTVVMEARMQNSGSWKGAVGMELGGQLYHDLSGAGELVDDTVVASIAEEIIRMRVKDTEAHAPVEQAAPPQATSGVDELATLLRNAELESCIDPLLAFGVESRADFVKYFTQGDAEKLEGVKPLHQRKLTALVQELRDEVEAGLQAAAARDQARTEQEEARVKAEEAMRLAAVEMSKKEADEARKQEEVQKKQEAEEARRKKEAAQPKPAILPEVIKMNQVGASPPEPKAPTDRYSTCNKGSLVLLDKGSPLACRLQAHMSGEKQRMVLNDGRALGPQWDTPRNYKGSWDYINLGVGTCRDDSMQVHLNKQGFVVWNNKHGEFVFEIAMAKLSAGNHLVLLKGVGGQTGKTMPEGCKSRLFEQNPDGTVSPTHARHLVLGISGPSGGAAVAHQAKAGQISTKDIAGCWACVCVPLGWAVFRKTAAGPNNLVHTGVVFLFGTLPLPFSEGRVRVGETNGFRKSDGSEPGNIVNHISACCSLNGLACGMKICP